MTTDPLPSLHFDRSLLGAGSLQGRVEAVFSHAAIVRLAPQGALLTLLHPSRELVPFGVTIPWELAQVATGDPVRLVDRQLSLGTTRLLLEGDGTDLQLASAPFSIEALKRQLPIATRLARRTRPELEKRALQRADEALRRVVLSLCTGHHPTRYLTAAVDELVGSGFGSTPTGDDWLVGLAAMGFRLADSGHTFRPAWEDLRSSLARVCAAATTPVSREMLRHAARGEFPQALLRLAGLVGSPSARDNALRESCRKLLAVGSQTGGDLLTGALSLASGVCAPRGGIA